MPIAFDSSSPALATSTTTAVTSASFNPPANSLLIACIGFEVGTSISMNSPAGTFVTWTLRGIRDVGDNPSSPGLAAIFTAPVAASGARTVRATSNGTHGALKVLVATGVHASTPVGAIGEGNLSAAPGNPAVYVSTVAGSRGVGVFNDYAATTIGTSGDNTGFPYLISGRTSGVAVHKDADTAVAGTTVNMAFTSSNVAPTINWCAIELIPATAVSAFTGWGLPIK